MNTLIVPFLDDNKKFAYGVEFGMLYARMSGGNEDVIADYFCLANQEQILLLANRLGWIVIDMEQHDRCWFWIEMTAPNATT